MTVKPRTLDNMGIDASSRYARDQAQLETGFVQDSRFIGMKAEVSVVKPYLPTEFEQYLMPNKLTMWAAFPQPPASILQGKPLFTYQMVPSLGSQEKQEADMERLEALKDSLDKDDESGQQKRRQQQEVKIVMKLLQTVLLFDRVLGSINAKRNQYQRG